jgi:hypothetical protein
MRTQNYIKNRGSTQTIIKNDSGKPSFNNINWSVDYDGNEANIDLDINNNGNDTIIKTKLDNNDLAQLLHIPAIMGSLDQRLLTDFPLSKNKNPRRKCKSMHLKNHMNPNQIMQQIHMKPRLVEEPIQIKIMDMMPPSSETDSSMTSFPSSDSLMIQESKDPISLLKSLTDSPNFSPESKLSPSIFEKYATDYKPEPLVTQLKYQPFLRPQRLKHNKSVKQLKAATTIKKRKGKRVGKTAARDYRTPLPKTMRIHLTSASGHRSKKSKGSGLRKTRKTKGSLSSRIFNKIF